MENKSIGIQQVFLAVILLFLLVYEILKKLIPAKKSRIALELNEDRLIYYLDNKDIPWNNICSINYLGNSKQLLKTLIVLLKDDSKFKIKLYRIKGYDDDIFNGIKSRIKN